MPSSGFFLLVVIVGRVLLVVALGAGLIWAVVGLLKNRHEDSRNLRLFYVRLSSVLALLIAVVLLVSRGNRPPAPSSGLANNYVEMSSPALTPYKAMYPVPRAKYGFTPLPKLANVIIEKLTGSDATSAGYDVMLHIYSSTERTVSFKFVNNKYQWIGEQEVWTGPHQYQLPNGGSTHEDISITYEAQPGFGIGPVNTLQIMYDGKDPRLSGKRSLSLKDVRPILKEWGDL